MLCGARFGTDSVGPEGDKQKTSSEAKNRVERPYVNLLGGLDWIDPSQSMPGNWIVHFVIFWSCHNHCMVWTFSPWLSLGFSPDPGRKAKMFCATDVTRVALQGKQETQERRGGRDKRWSKASSDGTYDHQIWIDLCTCRAEANIRPWTRPDQERVAKGCIWAHGWWPVVE